MTSITAEQIILGVLNNYLLGYAIMNTIKG